MSTVSAPVARGARQCSAHSTTHGGQCKNPAMTGQSVCRSHGGAAPQNIAAAQQRILKAADPAAARLVELLRSESPAVALAAARDLLDRAGLGATQRVSADVTHHDGDSELDAEIRRLVGELGLVGQGEDPLGAAGAEALGDQDATALSGGA